MKRVKYLFIIVILFLVGLNSCKNGRFRKRGIEDSVTGYGEVKALKLKKNVDVSKSAINYFDLDSVDTSKFKIREDDTPFKIVDHGPVEELPVEMKHPTIYVMFSHPVVPLSKLGDMVKDSKIMKIEPEIEGIYRWYGTKLYSFEPTEKYMPQRKYTVTVSKDTRSLGGKKLEGKRKFSFHTEYLDIAEFFPGTELADYSMNDVPLEEAKRINISFTYPVNLKVIKDYIKITSSGRNYKFKISRPKKEEGMSENFIKRSIVVNVEGDLYENSKVEVILLKGARSEEDYIGRETDVIKSFHTIKPFKYRYYDTYSYSFPRSEKADVNPVYFIFTHPIDKESLKGKISVSLPIIDIDENIDVWGKTIKVSNLPVKYDMKYVVTIDKGIKDIYGRPLDKSPQVEIEVPSAASYSYFPNRGTKILEAQFEPKIIYEYQNIYDGDWKIAKIDDPYKQFSGTELGPYDFSDLKKNVKHYEILDLSPYLNSSGKGFVGMSWNFGKKDKKGNRSRWAKEDLQLQVTDIGVTTRYAYNKIIVLANSLSTGDPIRDAKVYILREHDSVQLTGKTDKEGKAVFELKEKEYITKFISSNKRDLLRIRVEKNDDKIEFVPNHTHNPYHFGIWSTSSPYYIQQKNAETFIFTDRGLYKPGETVTFRGIDRDLIIGEYSVYQGKYDLSVRENKYKSKPFHTDSGTTTESGGFYGSFKVPENADPGYYKIEYTREGYKSYASFQIANFRRLNFAVSVKKPDVTYFTGDTVSMNVRANYLAGGSLGGGDYEYSWTKGPAYYRPKGKNWKSYRFGPDKYDSTSHLTTKNGKLSPTGEVNAKQKTEEGIRGMAYNYNLEARIEDIDRQMVAGRRSAVVHPSSFYIGAKLDTGDDGWWSPFVKKGDKVNVDYACVRPSGELFDDFDKKIKLNVKLFRIDWKIAKQKGVYRRINMRYERVEEVEYEKEFTINDPTGKFSISPKECGSYFIEIESMDKNERTAVTRLSFYSTGSSWVRWRQEGDEDIILIADKGEYEPGEKVKLLVQSPIPKGKYLVTIEREGIFEEKIIELEGSANTIDIPVKEEYLPIFYVALSSYSKREKIPPNSYFQPDLGKPKGYFGITSIKVSTDPKELDIEIIPSKSIWRPGENAEVTIKAEKNGKPMANTEITFMAADRGVLDLINYHVQDPINFFYSTEKFPLAVYGADSRSLLIDPVTYEMEDLPGGDGEADADDEKMKRRKDFRPTAVFKPYLKTDKNGIVKIKFKLPDTLTTYRCTAVGVRKDLFGIEENEIMVQNPINIRTALPRRLRVRDTSFAGVIATNLDSKDHEITVSIESDLLSIDGENKKRINIASNTSVEIPFKLLALNTGEATLVFTIISDVLKEELEEKLTIEKPLVKEAFTTTGKTKVDPANNRKGFAEEGVIIPSNIAEGYGGFTIILDSTRLASLSESIRYLFNYPYGCLEQRTSRLLPLVLFGDKIVPFGLDSKVGDVKKTIENGLSYIGKFQNNDGGFPFWVEEGGKSSEYSTIKFAHILYFAEKKGYKTPTNLDRAKLLNFISRIQDSKYASFYTKLYALYIQSLYGYNIILKAEDFLNYGDKLGLSGYGFLGLAFLENGKRDRAQTILQKIKNFMKVGTRTIDLVETYEKRYYFDSDVTNLALLLMLYEKLDPRSDFVEKITTTLMKRQKYGYWVNTSDTSWALQALAQVFGEETGTATNFTAKVTMEEKELINMPFKGISKESFIKNINFDDEPLIDLERDKLYPFKFNIEGKGTLFYTTTIRYALPSEVVIPRDEGFSVFTEMMDLDGNRIEGNDLELGETYKMRAIISTSKRRNFVAARLPIPSGAEILDASFVTTAAYDEKGGTSNRKITRESVYGDEYSYDDEGYLYGDGDGYYMYSLQPIQKIMDNEVRYFFDDFYEGKQEVEFLFRVTTAGIYPTPPAYVECMYEEEVFGRSGGKLYIIKDE